MCIASVDHSPHAHPASPSHELPADWTTAPKSSSASFSSYRQQAQQHGPLGRAKGSADGSLGSMSGHSLGPVAPTKGDYFDRNDLPARFRRTPIDLTEIDAIETGGATLVC
jgi:small subunit ribosomal protein YMR-31